MKINNTSTMKITHLSKQLKALKLENEILKKHIKKMEEELTCLWSHRCTENWGICLDDYSMHDLYENLNENYAFHDDGFIILKKMWVYTAEDGWLRPEELGEEQ